MSATNISLLAASLVLQLLLLALLFTRRRASNLRFFTALLCFYAVRSVLLVLLFSWVSAGSYVEIYTVLSAVDVILQIALAVEFSFLILHAGERRYLPRALLIPAIFLSAVALAAGIAGLLPSHSRAPADRASIFTGILFLALLVWSFSVLLVRWQRWVLLGLAAFGGAGIVSQVGRNFAAIHQNAQAYRVWSYSNAGLYLITLGVWIAVLWRSDSQPVDVSALTSKPRADLHGDGSRERPSFHPQRSL